MFWENSEFDNEVNGRLDGSMAVEPAGTKEPGGTKPRPEPVQKTKWADVEVKLNDDRMQQ